MRNPSAIEGKLTRARTQLLLGQPFFGSLCLRLKLTPGEVPTMATDGQRILYDPGFVEKLKPAELEGVLAHEVLHCALGHHCRRGERDPRLWNQAADLAINPLLLENGFTLPAGALLDRAFDHLSAEEIYARLRENKAAPPKSGRQPQTDNTDAGNASEGQAHNEADGDSREPAQAPDPHTPEPGGERPGGFGEVLDAAGENGSSASPLDRSRQQQDWSIAAEQAMRSARVHGHRPAMLERSLRESRRSRQDWRAILREFISSSSRSPADYRWTPPNRRYVAAGLYLPSIERSDLGPIVVAIDTSGSIRSAELEQFAGEISAISEEAQPESLHILYCDSAVRAEERFAASEPVHLHPRGGGGTDFRPPFAWVEEKEIAPSCLVYLTDLCCDSYPEAPRYPVLWVTHSRRRAPFGETIRMEMEPSGER
jgi:predicted metal-dependent peptidase